jgi:ribosomal protein S18 acetylase RimI-like enzyme
MRLSRDGTVYVLEVNANPDLSPDAGFQASLQAANIPFESFVENILSNAFARYQASVKKKEEEKVKGTSSSTQTIIRNSTPADKSAILKIVADAKVFRPDEITIAAEVLECAVNTNPHKDYESLTCEVNGQVAGWLCWGPASCSIGTYEIYWLVVAPQFQRMKIGKKLLEHAEILIRNRGGHLIVIETSSRSDYNAARNFYTRMGYLQAGSIPDFFTRNDNKVIYIKQLSPAEEKK